MKSGNDERLFDEKRRNLKLKREIEFLLSMEGITNNKHIQILTQSQFFILFLGQVLLDSL